MENAIKLPMFKGVGSEDPEQFWSIVSVVWEAHEVTDNNIKKATLVSALKNCALIWYIKHSSNHPNARIADI